MEAGWEGVRGGVVRTPSARRKGWTGRVRRKPGRGTCISRRGWKSLSAGIRHSCVSVAWAHARAHARVHVCGNVNSPRLSSADVIIRGVGRECDFWSTQYGFAHAMSRLFDGDRKRHEKSYSSGLFEERGTSFLLIRFLRSRSIFFDSETKINDK